MKADLLVLATALGLAALFLMLYVSAPAPHPEAWECCYWRAMAPMVALQGALAGAAGAAFATFALPRAGALRQAAAAIAAVALGAFALVRLALPMLLSLSAATPWPSLLIGVGWASALAGIAVLLMRGRGRT